MIITKRLVDSLPRRKWTVEVRSATPAPGSDVHVCQSTPTEGRSHQFDQRRGPVSAKAIGAHACVRDSNATQLGPSDLPIGRSYRRAKADTVATVFSGHPWKLAACPVGVNMDRRIDW